MTPRIEGQYYRPGNLFERVREYLKLLRLPAPDKRPREQRKNHDGTDQDRFRKAARPTSEENPERYSRDGPTSGPSDSYYGDQSDEASFPLDVVMRVRFVIPAQPLMSPT